MDPQGVAEKNARNLNFITSDATKVKKTSLALLMVNGKKGDFLLVENWQLDVWLFLVVFFVASTSHKL